MGPMSHPDRLRRTPALWTSYLITGLYSFLLSAIGPAVPFLRQEFGFDYTLAALHLSAFAVGMIVAGFLTPAALRLWGPTRSLWGGMAGILAGLTALVLAPAPWVSLAGILVAGVTGTVSLSINQNLIAVQAGPRKGQGLMESNVFASLAAAAGPLTLALGLWWGTGWRTLWPVFLLALAATTVFGFRTLRPVLRASAPAEVDRSPTALPAGFRRNFVLILVGVSVEWGIVFWAAEYLVGLPGGSKALATLGAGVLQLACVAGRFFSSQLIPRWGERRLMLAAIALTAVGFPLYWTLAHPVAAFGGLILCGLGVCTFYPLALSMALGSEGEASPRASALAVGASGLSMLAAPVALGAIADHGSLSSALLVIPAGLAAMVGLLLLRRRDAV